MLHVDIPTLPEFKALVLARADACVSIYLPTTPLTADVGASRIEFGNLTKRAIAQLDAAGIDKHRRTALEELLADLGDDDEFWKFQANSLAVLATPEAARTFRLPNKLNAVVEVADRFHLTPLLRAITFPHEAVVLALSENSVRLVEVFADMPPREVKVPDLPKDAASAVGRSTVNIRSPNSRIHMAEGQKVLLRSYARQVDAALRGVLAGRETPLVLAATQPLGPIFRSVNTYPGLAEETIALSPDRMSEAELAAAARTILDGLYAQEVDAFKALFAEWAGQKRTTTDVADAARAATFGAIERLLVNIGEDVPGTIDEMGRVSLATGPSAKSYGILDEIAGRALLSGARVLGVRNVDIPNGANLAAILRYPV